jgi:hypothetical protein
MGTKSPLDCARPPQGRRPTNDRDAERAARQLVSAPAGAQDEVLDVRAEVPTVATKLHDRQQAAPAVVLDRRTPESEQLRNLAGVEDVLPGKGAVTPRRSAAGVQDTVCSHAGTVVERGGTLQPHYWDASRTAIRPLNRWPLPLP